MLRRLLLYALIGYGIYLGYERYRDSLDALRESADRNAATAEQATDAQKKHEGPLSTIAEDRKRTEQVVKDTSNPASDADPDAPSDSSDSSNQ